MKGKKSRDIEVIESILDVLEKCYLVHFMDGDMKAADDCLKDISICKLELMKIKDRRLAAENAHNG